MGGFCRGDFIREPHVSYTYKFKRVLLNTTANSQLTDLFSIISMFPTSLLLPWLNKKIAIFFIQPRNQKTYYKSIENNLIILINELAVVFNKSCFNEYIYITMNST